MTEQEAIKKIRELQAHNNGLFDLDCHFATNIAVRCIEESQKYREINDRLKTIYGECDGLFETAVEQALENAVAILENHEGIDIGHPYQSRLLTDEDVDKWEAYKAIGTPDECRAAVDKKKADKELESHDEKHILKSCLGLMQEMVNDFAEWYRWQHGEDSIEELDEEEIFCVRKTYFRIVQKLFLLYTNHSGGTSTRAKCEQLGVDWCEEISFDWSDEE